MYGTLFGEQASTLVTQYHQVLTQFFLHMQVYSYVHLTWGVPRIIILEKQSSTIRSNALVSTFLHVCIQQIHETLSFCFNSLIVLQ